MPRYSSPAELHEFARGIEAEGFSTLLSPDHLGRPAALVSLVSAAAVTTTLRVGTMVLNNDFHHSVQLAQEVATVDALTAGRFDLGMGSGWMKPEYDILGIDYDRPIVRARHLRDAWEVMKQAWAGEPTFAFGGSVVPAAPAPAQQPRPPLLVGGRGDAILRFAAAEADIVGITAQTWNGTAMKMDNTGLSLEAYVERVDFVRKHAEARFDHIELNLPVSGVYIGNDVEKQVAEVAVAQSSTPEVVRESPLFLIGSKSAVVDKLQRVREELGFSYVSTMGQYREALIPIVAELAGR